VRFSPKLKCKNEEIFGIFNFQKLKGEQIKKLIRFVYMVQVGGQKHRMMFKLFYFHISFYGQTWLNLAMDGSQLTTLATSQH